MKTIGSIILIESLVWLSCPAAALHCDGLAGRAEYAQLLHGASEIQYLEEGPRGRLGSCPARERKRRAECLTRHADSFPRKTFIKQFLSI